MRKLANNSALLAVSLVLVLISGCGDNITSNNGDNVDNTEFTVQEDFNYTIDITNHTGISLQSINGSIQVVGTSDDSQVIITGIRMVGSESPADAEQYLDSLQVEIDSNSETIYIRTEQPDQSHGRMFRVDYDITLPVDFEVVIANINGSISVDSVENDIVISNINGQVGFFEIEGNINIGLVNGQIIGRMILPSGGEANFECVNGSIDLMIPTNTSAEFISSRINGNIYLTDLILTDMEVTSTTLAGILGTGDGNIRLSTINGNTYVDGY